MHEEIEDQQDDKHYKLWLWIYAIAVIIIVGSLWAQVGIRLPVSKVHDLLGNEISTADQMQYQGTFGDQFGAVNALFTGLAFGFFLIALYMQGYQLKLQRKELRRQRAEMELTREEMELTRHEIEGQRQEMEASVRAQRIAGFLASVPTAKKEIMDSSENIRSELKKEKGWRKWVETARLGDKYQTPYPGEHPIRVYSPRWELVNKEEELLACDRSISSLNFLLSEYAGEFNEIETVCSKLITGEIEYLKLHVLKDTGHNTSPEQTDDPPRHHL